jgi:hypothetical protein
MDAAGFVDQGAVDVEEDGFVGSLDHGMSDGG